MVSCAPVNWVTASRLAAIVLGCALTLPLHAAPDAAGEPAPPAAAAPDPITSLLAERGLLPAGSVAVVQSMRDAASELVMSAMSLLGVPYRRGGDSAETGFDCSGFTRHIFEMSIGLVLPRRADQQAKAAELQNVPRDQLKPGDLVFFNTMRRAFSHVGIYVGDGKFIHSPRAGAKVRVESLYEGYWAARFNGARRAPLPTTTTLATDEPAAAPAAH